MPSMPPLTALSLRDTPRHQGMRRQLIEELQTKGVRDPAVLQAMLEIPRHFFLDHALSEMAYQDKAMPIGEGQTISQPYTVAFQSSLLEVAPHLKMNCRAKLFVGDGSLGLPSFAPFDRILVTAASPSVPMTLQNQLKIGGHLVIPVGTLDEQTMLKITRLSEGEFKTQSYPGFRFVPLTGAEGWPR